MKKVSKEEMDRLSHSAATVSFDDGDKRRNLYGCLPCPACESPYRAAYNRGEFHVIECDNCGLHQKEGLL